MVSKGMTGSKRKKQPSPVKRPSSMLTWQHTGYQVSDNRADDMTSVRVYTSCRCAIQIEQVSIAWRAEGLYRVADGGLQGSGEGGPLRGVRRGGLWICGATRCEAAQQPPGYVHPRDRGQVRQWQQCHIVQSHPLAELIVAAISLPT